MWVWLLRAYCVPSALAGMLKRVFHSFCLESRRAGSEEQQMASHLLPPCHRGTELASTAQPLGWASRTG